MLAILPINGVPDGLNLLREFDRFASVEEIQARAPCDNHPFFTNADANHARRLLDHLGLSHLFSDLFHIESAGFIPKPDPKAFERLVAAHAIDAGATAFFEDRAPNLEPAAALGMATVLVGPDAEQATTSPAPVWSWIQSEANCQPRAGKSLSNVAATSQNKK